MMIMPRPNVWWKGIRSGTLRGKLALTLFIASAVPIILVGYVSYYGMYTVQIERNNEDIREQAHNVYRELENRLDELGRSSQLLAAEGGIGRELIHYLESGSHLDRSRMYQDLVQSTANVAFANPGFNVLLYYAPEYKEPILFPNVPVSAAAMSMDHPSLFVKKLLTYRGPHPSLNGQPRTLVVSLLREMEYDGDMPIYIYVERDISDILPASSSQWIIVNEAGETAYSDLESLPAGKPFPAELHGYQLFGAEGGQPWTLHRVIPDDEYFHVINRWKLQVVLIALVSLLVGVLLAWIVWRMIYSPIQSINRAIRKYSYDVEESPPKPTGLQEFDHVLNSFQQMKERIAGLISDVEEKEKRRGQLEVEKLLVQINPHFLHNTLNTIQWIARMNGQQDIAKLVSVFTRILHYNLGKKSIIVTMREEVAAIRDYIELQSIRYDHQFHMEIDVDPETLDIPVPRFILQPLVENAMYHGGQDDNMEIRVRIRKLDGGLSLSVRDNGDGIPEERLQELLQESDELRKSGLGIGLSYVKKMLDIYYDETAVLRMNSAPGLGTEIDIRLPERLKEVQREP
jgi:two-component system sensor histidine kinase YesM